MKELAQAKEWDFDVWMKLARNDPERFEALRRQVIDELIESAPEDRKLHLRRLQWRVDRIRERSVTPMAATLAISKMMWESFYDLRDHYQGLFSGIASDNSRHHLPAAVARSAKILPFRPRAHA